jgi:crotonobetainyl-CoA:carnitine CoA-transferase CaiB-like acyl-CoA transferase
VTATMKGVRVVEVADHMFVPAASAILSDWGADVIKVEHVERGDAMRGLASTGAMDLGDGRVHALLEHANRGKRSLGLDLTSTQGIEILYRLVRDADVFLTNKLTKVRKRLKIDRQDIVEQNSRIIYVRGTGYGTRGPDAEAGGYDFLAFWARSGIAVGATPLGAAQIPAMPAPAFGDSIGGMTIAGGISAALFHRERTGESPMVDVSLLSSALWAAGAGIALSDQLGRPWTQPPADGSALRNALVNTYQCADGKWIALTCLQGFHYWPGARDVFELNRLASDERFTSPAAFEANAPTLAMEIGEAVAKRPRNEWVNRLAKFDGQWSLVQDSREVMDDPQIEANGYVLSTNTADGLEVRLVTSPVQFDEVPVDPGRAPAFNEHCEDILGELGMNEAETIQMKVDGVVA